MGNPSDRATILEAHAVTAAALGHGFVAIGNAGFGNKTLVSIGRAFSIAATEIEAEAAKARREAGQ